LSILGIKSGCMKSGPWRNSPVGPRKERMGEKVDRLVNSLKDFFVGIAYFEIGQTARQEKLVWQDLFMLLTFGDLFGVPIFPPLLFLTDFAPRPSGHGSMEKEDAPRAGPDGGNFALKDERF